MQEKIEIDTYAHSCPDRINCPAKHRVSSLPGGVVVQGRKIPAAVRAELVARGMPPEEDAVWIPDELEAQ